MKKMLFACHNSVAFEEDDCYIEIKDGEEVNFDFEIENKGVFPGGAILRKNKKNKSDNKSDLVITLSEEWEAHWPFSVLATAIVRLYSLPDGGIKYYPYLYFESREESNLWESVHSEELMDFSGGLSFPVKLQETGEVLPPMTPLAVTSSGSPWLLSEHSMDAPNPGEGWELAEADCSYFSGNGLREWFALWFNRK